VGQEVTHLGQGIKAIFSQHDLMPTLFKKDFRTAPDGVAVINHEDFDG
jgi:hypothetical protein